MKQKRFKSSVVIPSVLLIYLMAMAYYGRGMLAAGESLKFYGVIACTLVILVVLHFSLKKKERLREQRNQDSYTTYEQQEQTKKSETNEQTHDSDI